jgi:hypothetical protein
MTDDQVILVPGTLRAYRIWTYSVKEPVESMVGPWPRRLLSIGWSYALEPAVQLYGRRSYVARCQYRTARQVSDRRHVSGETEMVPAQGCSCGFYGVYVGGLAHTYLASRRPLTVASCLSSLIAGSVLMSGRVVLGANGVVRAEKMRLEALFSLAGSWHTEGRTLLRSAARLYKVPGYTNPRNFERAYPLADVTQLTTEVDPIVAMRGGDSAPLLIQHQTLAHALWCRVYGCFCSRCKKPHDHMRAEPKPLPLTAAETPGSQAFMKTPPFIKALTADDGPGSSASDEKSL